MRTTAADTYVFETDLHVGLAKAPYLADHGFHGLIVLPGAYYVAAALAVHRQNGFPQPTTLRNIQFRRPVVLSQSETKLRLCVRELKPGTGTYLYLYFEEPGPASSQNLDAGPLAQLEIEENSMALLKNEKAPSPLIAFSTQTSSIAGHELYGAFRKNGNEYGTHFQKITSAWPRGNEVLAKIQDTERLAHTTPFGLHPILLDAITQTLGATQISQGDTFVLESIQSIRVMANTLPDELWAHARQTAVSASEQRFTGDVLVVDADGRSVLALSGITCRQLEKPPRAQSEEGQRIELCIAATTTADALEESLHFWAHQFSLPLHVEFAPHNQVMQQLLDPASALAQNRRGTNIILLDLEQWLGAADKQTLSHRWKERELILGEDGRVLPNGLQIRELNRHETDYLFQEIFEDRCYLRHGIELQDGATVLDIGANIGLFSLFVLSQCRNPRLLAFEPAPASYACLEANLKLHAPVDCAQAFQYGVSDQAKRAVFTYYEHASVFSTFHADAAEDQVALQQVVHNMLEDDALAPDIQQLVQGRLEPRTFHCDLVSVSQIIRQHGIDRIDLLKIDAERSEREILHGIDDEHWPLIQQLVIEVHDRSRTALRQVEAILQERGFRCAISEEALLSDSGLINLYARREHPLLPAVARATDLLRGQIDNFGAALNHFVQQSEGPVLLAVLPRTPRVGSYAPIHERLNEAERQLLALAHATGRVTCLRSDLLFSPIAAANYYDEHSQELAEMPYTPEAYTAAGTALFRAIVRPFLPPFKVLVLDCDDTLWQGVCAEDGPEGVVVGAGHRFLQQWALEQTKRGLLVCLCSKNNEEDVWAVFDQRTDMLLRREHFAAWRINWERKSDNLRALAEQLGLGLESFIFLDDNALECAEVRAACPEVLSLTLPGIPEARPSFLERIWIWDASPRTEADQARNLWYQTNRERNVLLQTAPSLQKFLESLDLQIEIGEPKTGQLGRVAQLTLRTNQFNFTQVRRTEQQLHQFLTTNSGCLVAHVRDRLGDYGLVGAILYQAHADHYEIDSFLLSCRALGKGVEHRMIRALSEHALKAGKTLMRAPFLPTARNRPALQFLQSVAGECLTEPAGKLVFTLSAPKCARLSFTPAATAAPVAPQATVGAPGQSVRRFQLSGVIQRLGEDLFEPGRILRAIRSRPTGPVTHRIENGPRTAGGTPGHLHRIFTAILGREDIDGEDNFFEIGGTSLKAVLVTAAIRRELGHEVTLVTLFECPTIKSLAAHLEAKGNTPGTAPGTAAAVQRGRQRRYPGGRRKDILL